MAGLEVHFLPEGEGGVTLVWESLFLPIPVPSSCFSSATVWVSCGASLSGLVWGLVLISPCSPTNLTPDKSLFEFLYA